MKKLAAIIVTYLFSFSVFAQNVGIGTAAPAQKLHVAGNTSTLRLEGLGTGGTFIYNPTFSTDKIVLASGTGDLFAMNSGANGSVLSIIGGIPTWTIMSPAWSLTGNSGTVAGINFLGTTDNVALMFKTNNQQSGLIESSGNKSVFLGYQAGLMVSAGSYNTFIGYQSGYSNTTGFENLFEGYHAGYSNTTGELNTFIGDQTGYSNTTGANNVFIGSQAGYECTTVGANTFVGANAGRFTVGGSDNTFIGCQSGYLNDYGSYNVFVGRDAGQSNTASYNIFVGYRAGFQNTTATGSHFIGSFAGYSNTSGNFNFFEGYQSGYSNTTGNSNYYSGFHAGYSNSTGSDNSFIGFESGYSNQTGSQNVYVGKWAGYSQSSGDLNTYVGFFSGQQCTTGNHNTFYGQYAGYAATTATYCTALGTAADFSSGNFINSNALGNNAVASANNQTVIGNTFMTSIGGYQNWSNISDGRFKRNVKYNVPGLTFINLLSPVTYNLDVDAVNDYFGVRDPIAGLPDADEARNQIRSGFIAQDVEKAANEIGYNFSGIVKPEQGNVYALRYAEFVVPLVQAVKELSFQNDSLLEASLKSESQIRQLQTVVEQLQAKLDQLTEMVAVKYTDLSMRSKQ